MDEILQEFLSETAETMEEISGEIVAWEADPADSARLDSIFRFVHTVKGSCGFLDLPRIGALSHAAEDALDAARNGRRDPTPSLVTAVLAVIDRILSLTEEIASTGSEPKGNDRALIDAVHSSDEAEPASRSEERRATDRAAAPGDDRGGALATPAAQDWRTIRVPLNLLDSMMNGVSDMVLARNEVARVLRSDDASGALSGAFERLSASVADMRNSVSQMRMQRIEKLFAPLPRLIRDVSNELGKKVEVSIDGGAVELDREMIESIRDPLTHILRNAIDHGIEPPQSGNQIIIEVRDDGAGISTDRLVAKAIAAKVVSAGDARSLSAAEKLDLIFAPGLTTAGEVTTISGRGVGMDIVRANIERIGGVVDIDNDPGSGLSVTLRVPLTLTIISGLTVCAADHVFAVPRASVSEIILQMNEAVRIDRAGGAEIAIVRGERLALVYLEDVLGLARPESDSIDRAIIITRGAGGHRYALSVADVYDHEELVIKPAAPAIMATGIYAGSTLPDNGRPMLLLDVTGIAERLDLGALDGVGGRSERSADTVAAADDERDQALLFHDFDGAVRAIDLAVIDRVDEVAVGAISRQAGRLRALVGGQMIAVHDCDIPAECTKIKLLRLNDGEAEVGYAMVDVVDVARLPATIAPAAGPGPIRGVALIGGDPVEILDPYWIFASLGAARSGATQPVCRLADGDEHWTRQFLAPLIAGAGYRVVYDQDEDAPAADIVIASDHSGAAADAGADDPAVLRLRKAERPNGKGDQSIYRYDKAAILGALDRMTRSG
jgi:two-component system chemotaxis sensor kinase CheA